MTVSEGGKLTIKESALLANDLETDNDPLRITAISDALNGRASMDGTAIFYVQDGSETITDIPEAMSVSSLTV